MDSRWSWEDDHWQSSWWESWRVFEPGNWKNVPDIKFVEKILPILKEQAGSEILSSSYGEPNLSGPPRCSGICIANSSDTTLHSPNRANIVYIYFFFFCWTNSLVRHWLLISGWTRWQHLRSITIFLSCRSWYDSCWAEAPKVGIARCSTSASEPEAFPKGLKSLCFSVNRIPNTWTAFSCSRIVGGASSKLES